MRLTQLLSTLSMIVVMASGLPAEGKIGAPNSAKPADPIVSGNNEFALKLYQQLQGQKGNLFYSPYSLSSALTMAAQGARGKTAEEMYAALSLQGDTAAIHEAMGKLISHFNGSSKKRAYQLSVANALWGQRNYSWKPDFLAECKNFYGSELNQVDFVAAPEDARTTINKWVEKQTHDKIKNLLPQGVLNGDTRLVLTNAIYFKSKWINQFKKEATKNEPFHLNASEVVNARMMHQTAHFNYAENEQCQVLEMPYVGGELSMVVLLPRKLDGLAEMEKSLTITDLNQALQQLQPAKKVQVIFPKYTMTCQFSLPQQLVKLGMTLAFSYRADFSGMSSQEPLFISDVIHKAFVDVYEEGTEAAAATAVVKKKSAGKSEQPLVFRADHPFLFLIRDIKTGTILFLGRVINPR